VLWLAAEPRGIQAWTCYILGLPVAVYLPWKRRMLEKARGFRRTVTRSLREDRYTPLGKPPASLPSGNRADNS